MNKSTSRILATSAFALAAFSQIGATDCGQVITDDGFDLWCGNQLCDWQLNKGAIEKVPTWHTGDDGVQFEGNGAEISQLSDVTSGDGACIEFDLLADVDPAVDMELYADIWGDGGAPEFQQRIIGTNFEPLLFAFKINGPYSGIRFTLQKNGDTSAVLAQLSGKIVDCTGVSQIIEAGPSPEGAYCGQLFGAPICSGDLVCTSTASGTEVDFNTTCGECSGSLSDGTWTDTCNNGTGAPQICGVVEPTQSNFGASTACLPTASKLLGERCKSNGECGSNICNEFGMCSTCDTGQSLNCSNGETCNSALPTDSITTTPPGDYPSLIAFICAPSQHLRNSGEACVLDADCSGSLHCVGTATNRCSDGRQCTRDVDCPSDSGDLTPGTCYPVGVVGGTCQ